jgi:hypothetical protein
LGSSRFARRYSGNRIFFLFLQVLRCFSSLGVPSRRYVFTSRYCSITNSGFPHSEISGSKLTYSSPKHIGVSPVLHRLLVPRHSPCALHNLTYSFRYTSHYRVNFTRSNPHVLEGTFRFSLVHFLVLLVSRNLSFVASLLLFYKKRLKNFTRSIT